MEEELSSKIRKTEETRQTSAEELAKQTVEIKSNLARIDTLLGTLQKAAQRLSAENKTDAQHRIQP